MAIRILDFWSNRDEWNLGMDMYVSTVARQSARSRTDAHADGSTFVPRKAAISGFATDPTRAFLANASKADRNHGVTFLLPLGSYEIVRANFIL